MIVAGINMPYTRAGMRLNDGGCAIFKDGELVAIAEERLTRKKHDSGFLRSLSYCMDAQEISLQDIDLFVVSSCCEDVLKSKDVHIEGVSEDKILVCPSHHLSHALSAYCLSGFDRSLVMVIDNEGNIIDDVHYQLPFHKRKMEHMSYYIADKNHIELIERDDVQLGKIGVGDAYRYFTHYLGFPSYVYAGKTMGLAAYGKADAYADKKIFKLRDGHIVCDIDNEYMSCISSLKRFLVKQGIDIKPRTPIDPLSQENADLARWIQRETEDILVEKVKYLSEKHQIRNICIAGGVGLNSVANAEILKRSGVERLFIFPAAGDDGQCVGNVMYGLMTTVGMVPHLPFSTAYLGRTYTNEIIQEAVRPLCDDPNYDILHFDDVALLLKKEAELLWNGMYVGHFDGRSEFGPRALGNRSIFANPCSLYAKDDLNRKIKFRENFRPFAPVVLYDRATDFFEIDRELPFMLVVATVKNREHLPAITHVDETARVQTITNQQNPRLCQLLKEFEVLSGVPVLLNTSFNIAGEPIVESPTDAVNCLKSTALNALSIGNILIIKKDCSHYVDDYIRFVTSLGENLDQATESI